MRGSPWQSVRIRCQMIRPIVHAILIVIDNTNADSEVRSKWLELANKHSVPIRCVLFTASAEICEHNDAVRALNEAVSDPQLLSRLIISQQKSYLYLQGTWSQQYVKSYSNLPQMNPEKRSILPSLAFKGFSSRYQRPALSEGFQDITEVAFKVSSSPA